MIEVEYVKFKGVIFDPNNRISKYIYSQEIIDRELSKYAEKIKNNTALGRFNPPVFNETGGYYPIFVEMNPLNCAFEVTNLIRNEDGCWIVEGKTLKTFYGKLLNSLLGDGVRLKPTLTGTGNVDENNVVSDDFSLIAIDIIPEGTKETNYEV